MEQHTVLQEVAAMLRSVGFWESRVDKMWLEGRTLHVEIVRDLPPGTARIAGLFPQEPTLPDMQAYNRKFAYTTKALQER